MSGIRCRRLSILVVCSFGLAPPAVRVEAQDAKGPGAEDDVNLRILQLERRIRELEEDRGIDDEELEKRIEDAVEKSHSRGILSLGGAEIELGGKLEINFVDTQNESDPTLGSTESPDPRLILDRFRLEPVLDIGRDIEVEAQIDFLPDDGGSLLKEATFSYEFRAEDHWKDNWWLRSRVQIGLDDRFNHIGPGGRVAETYPLLGTAFWRDEQVGLIWETRLGDKRGAPRKRPRARRRVPGGGRPETDVREEFEEPSRREKTSSTTYEPLDFQGNPGALHLFFSLGDGYTLDGKAITKDTARLQEIVQDDRETEDGLTLGEVGLGAGYERDFNWFGELGLLFFYFEDDLKDDSSDFLRSELGLGVNSEFVNRLGVRVDYHLEAYHVLDRWMDTYPGDGLYLRFEWIDARDGPLDRDGWYVQGSYRFSFVRPLIADRYIRYLEPVVRYGELDVRVDDDPAIPFTWDRRQFLIGGVFGITRRVLVKTEYSFHRESTGDGDADNDEFLAQLLIEF